MVKRSQFVVRRWTLTALTGRKERLQGRKVVSQRLDQQEVGDRNTFLAKQNKIGKSSSSINSDISPIKNISPNKNKEDSVENLIAENLSAPIFMLNLLWG